MERNIPALPALLVGLVVTVSIQASPAFAQGDYIGQAPVVDSKEREGSTALGPTKLLLQIAPGIGRGTLNNSLALGLGLRVPIVVHAATKNLSIVGRVSFSTGGVLQKYEVLWIPVALGPEVAVWIGSPAEGWTVVPSAAFEYGGDILITEGSYGRPGITWGPRLRAAVDFIIPGVRSVLLGVSYTRSWESWDGGSWAERRIKLVESRFSIAIGIPLGRLGTGSL